MVTSVCVIVFLSLSGPLSLVATAISVSFPLTYIDAESSLVRSVAADPSDLPQAMPMRSFVAAGRAMRARVEKHRKVRRPLVGKLSYKGELYLTLPVGNPPQHVIFLLDTGSEFTWSQCSPCMLCAGTKPPPFDFGKSSSFLSIPCDSELCRTSIGFSASSSCGNNTSNATWPCIFDVVYGDGSIDAGFISVDSFHLGPHFSKPMVFGCAVVALDTVLTPSSGLMGLNAGPFSFTSQLFGSHSGILKKFAHCLPDRFTNLNAHGRIEFGNYELPVNLSYTPLTPPYSPLGNVYYYVDLKGITVGESLIKVSMKAHERGMAETGGTIFDSGTTVTRLVKSVYSEMVKEMRTQTAHLRPFASKSAGSDLCYKVPLHAEELPNLPKVILHFAGMVNLELGPGSILYAAESDDKGISLCLAFITASGSNNLNIIGNYQQQNYWVEYNLQTSSLGLAKACSCAK